MEILIARRVCHSPAFLQLCFPLQNLIFNLIANGLTNMMNECANARALTFIHSFRYPIYRFIFNNFFTGGGEGRGVGRVNWQIFQRLNSIINALDGRRINA